MFPCMAYCGYWWVLPIVMIAMMGLCFFVFRPGVVSTMCGSRSGNWDSPGKSASDRPLDILNKEIAQRGSKKREHEK